MLQDSGADLLLSRGRLAETAAEFWAEVVLLDENMDRIDTDLRTPAPEAIDDEQVEALFAWQTHRHTRQRIQRKTYLPLRFALG